MGVFLSITEVAAGVPPVSCFGDYNNDSFCATAPDYVAWRNAYHRKTLLPNDLTPQSVDLDDYRFWRENFGNTSAAVASSIPYHTAVPEPSTALLAALAATAGSMGTRRRRATPAK